MRRSVTCFLLGLGLFVALAISSASAAVTFSGSLTIPQPRCSVATTGTCNSATSAVVSAEAHLQATISAVLSASTGDAQQAALAAMAQAVADLELAIALKLSICGPDGSTTAQLQADVDATAATLASAQASLTAWLNSSPLATDILAAVHASADGQLALSNLLTSLVAHIKATIRLNIKIGLTCNCGTVSAELNAAISVLANAVANLSAALSGTDAEALASAQAALQASLLLVARLKISLTLLCPCQPGDGGFVVGDPQFVGLRGQSYQVHGVSGEVYNIVSDNDVQYNSRFVFLDAGECPVVNGKKQKGCWSHPGSYLGELGLKTRAGDKIHLVSGAAKSGFAAIEVNGKSLEVGDTVLLNDEMGSVSLNTTHLATVTIGKWEFAFENSDMFVNQRVRVTKTNQLRSHGLLGQTWRDTTYPNPIKYVQGQVDDYAIRSGDIFGDEFVFNVFN